MTFLDLGWPAPPNVKAFTTTIDAQNLARHVGDDPTRVDQNRRGVRAACGWTREPLWLSQVHGTTIVRADDGNFASVPEADGAVTEQPGQPLVVMTADCLPVVLCDRAGTVVGVVHAGWKGLLHGVLEAGLAALGRPAGQVLAAIGPAIAQVSYQVGPEVREAYLAHNPAHEAEFAPDGLQKWKFDLPGAARRRLVAAGVGSVTLSGWDTLARPDLFYSHRRTTLEGGSSCGRQATFIVLESRSLS